MALSSAAADTDGSVHSTFASRYVQESLPWFRMPDRSIPKDVAYQIISYKLMLDGNPRLNLSSFVTTWMEPECDKLIMEAINKNYIDMDEYLVTTEMQRGRATSSTFVKPHRQRDLCKAASRSRMVEVPVH